MATRILFLMTVIMLCAWSVPARIDATTLTLSPRGNTHFVLHGNGLVSVGGIDATLEYDANSFTNPRITRGALMAGAVLVSNTKKPGSVRVAIVKVSRKGISGSGNLLTITFDRLGQSPVQEMSMKATVVDVKGAKVTVDTSVQQAREVSPSLQTEMSSGGSSLLDALPSVPPTSTPN